MDIKLILENQLVIMLMMLELRHEFSASTSLLKQIQETRERIDRWGSEDVH